MARSPIDATLLQQSGHSLSSGATNQSVTPSSNLNAHQRLSGKGGAEDTTLSTFKGATSNLVDQNSHQFQQKNTTDFQTEQNSEIEPGGKSSTLRDHPSNILEFTKAGPTGNRRRIHQTAQQSTSDDDYDPEPTKLNPVSPATNKLQGQSDSESSHSDLPPLMLIEKKTSSAEKSHDLKQAINNNPVVSKEQTDDKKMTLRELLAAKTISTQVKPKIQVTITYGGVNYQITGIDRDTDTVQTLHKQLETRVGKSLYVKMVVDHGTYWVEIRPYQTLRECNITNDSVINAQPIQQQEDNTFQQPINSQRGHPSSINKNTDKKRTIWQERSASRSPEGYDRQFNSNMYRAQMAAQDVSTIINHHNFFPQKQNQIDNAGRITPVAAHPHTVFLSNSRIQHHGASESNAGAEQSRDLYDTDEPASLADSGPKTSSFSQAGAGSGKQSRGSRRITNTKRDAPNSIFNTITGSQSTSASVPGAGVLYPHNYYSQQANVMGGQPNSQMRKDVDLDFRHYFKPQPNKGQSKAGPTQQQIRISDKNDQMNSDKPGDCRQVVIDWFTTLSDAERINCLTIYCPSRIQGILEWYKGEQLQDYQQTAAHQYLSSASQLQNPPALSKDEILLAPCTSSFKTATDYNSYMTPTAGYTSQSQSRNNFYLQNMYSAAEHDQGALNAISLYQPPRSNHNSIDVTSYGTLTLLKTMKDLLAQVRLKDYQVYTDTISVDQALIEEPANFFALMEMLSDKKAFRKPVTITTCPQQKGRLQIETPTWVTDRGKTTNYLTSWVAAMFEESIWAHFYYHQIVLGNKAHALPQGIAQQNIRKHELSNLFENRDENTSLQSTDDLANYLSKLGKKDQKKLYEKLKERTKYYPTGEEQGQNSFIPNSEQPVKPDKESSDGKKKQAAKGTPPPPVMEPEIREIIEHMSFMIKAKSHAKVIIYLSESPIQRESLKKDTYCREMLTIISDELRASVQNSLMEEPETKIQPKVQSTVGSSKNVKSQQAQQNEETTNRIQQILNYPQYSTPPASGQSKKPKNSQPAFEAKDQGQTPSQSRKKKSKKKGDGSASVEQTEQSDSKSKVDKKKGNSDSTSNEQPGKASPSESQQECGNNELQQQQQTPSKDATKQRRPTKDQQPPLKHPSSSQPEAVKATTGNKIINTIKSATMSQVDEVQGTAAALAANQHVISSQGRHTPSPVDEQQCDQFKKQQPRVQSSVPKKIQETKQKQGDRKSGDPIQSDKSALPPQKPSEEPKRILRQRNSSSQSSKTSLVREYVSSLVNNLIDRVAVEQHLIAQQAEKLLNSQEQPVLKKIQAAKKESFQVPDESSSHEQIKKQTDTLAADISNVLLTIGSKVTEQKTQDDIPEKPQQEEAKPKKKKKNKKMTLQDQMQQFQKQMFTKVETKDTAKAKQSNSKQKSAQSTTTQQKKSQAPAPAQTKEQAKGSGQVKEKDKQRPTGAKISTDTVSNSSGKRKSNSSLEIQSGIKEPAVTKEKSVLTAGKKPSTNQTSSTSTELVTKPNSKGPKTSSQSHPQKLAIYEEIGQSLIAATQSSEGKKESEKKEDLSKASVSKTIKSSSSNSSDNYQLKNLEDSVQFAKKNIYSGTQVVKQSSSSNNQLTLKTDATVYTQAANTLDQASGNVAVSKTQQSTPTTATEQTAHSNKAISNSDAPAAGSKPDAHCSKELKIGDFEEIDRKLDKIEKQHKSYSHLDFAPVPVQNVTSAKSPKTTSSPSLSNDGPTEQMQAQKEFPGINFIKNSSSEDTPVQLEDQEINLNTNAMAFTPSMGGSQPVSSGFYPQGNPALRTQKQQSVPYPQQQTQLNYAHTGNLGVPGKAPLHPNTNLRPATKPIEWSKLDNSSSFEPSVLFQGDPQASSYTPNLIHDASPLLGMVDTKKASPFQPTVQRTTQNRKRQGSQASKDHDDESQGTNNSYKKSPKLGAANAPSQGARQIVWPNRVQKEQRRQPQNGSGFKLPGPLTSKTKEDTLPLKKLSSVQIGDPSDYLPHGSKISGNLSPQLSGKQRKSIRHLGSGRDVFGTNPNSQASSQVDVNSAEQKSPQSQNGSISTAIRLSALPFDPTTANRASPELAINSQNSSGDQNLTKQNVWDSNSTGHDNQSLHPQNNPNWNQSYYRHGSHGNSPSQHHGANNFSGQHSGHHSGFEKNRPQKLLQNLSDLLTTNGSQNPNYMSAIGGGSNFQPNQNSYQPMQQQFPQHGNYGSPMPVDTDMMQRSQSFTPQMSQFEPNEQPKSTETAAQIPKMNDQQLVEDSFYFKFDEDIYHYTKGIEADIDQWQPERDIVLAKIQAIAASAFKGQDPKIRQFGSLMTGLALQCSDMDMAVTGLNIIDRQEMIDEMHKLSKGLSKWDLVQDLKAIDTASIPVIKANVNLDQLRYLIQNEKDQDPGSPESKESGSSTRTKQPDDKLLPIDITFDDSPPDSSAAASENNSNFIQSPGLMGNMMSQSGFAPNNGFFGFPGQVNNSPFPPSNSFGSFGALSMQKTHLGLASCKLLKDYVARYACLKEVAILLKLFLSDHNLNVPYNGGISSYSLVLLIVAYMNYYKLQQSQYLTPSRLLMGFLDFYGNSFQPRSFGINTINDEAFYNLPMAQQYETQFAIVDPVNPTNNTARNSHQTAQILDKFRSVHKGLKLLSQQQQKRYQESRSSEANKQQMKPIIQGSADFPTVAESTQEAKAKESVTEESGNDQKSRDAKLTDDALEQQVNNRPAAQQKAQEQQQVLPPAECSAGQERTAGAPEELTTRDVYPASISLSHDDSDRDSQASAALTLASLFYSYDFVARFLLLEQQQPEDNSPQTESKSSERV